MVGKGDASSSRIFHQCYLKCCKLQNLTPLTTVVPGSNGKLLDFCVDRIKYTDWPPILNALSCDLSLHSVSVRCRQQVKTVLEHIDCERLAKTVNKRSVILTNFMLSNLVEALTQLLSNTTLLTSLLLEGLPLKIPYLNPLCEAFLSNSSLQHIYLPRCLIGDAGCLALCKAVRSLPNILTLDLTGCELTVSGASYIAELVKYQKIHRYSENWVHTLRYRLPELDAMAGLRRITLCSNPALGDAGVGKLLDVLADDLWIKALDAQNCGLSEQTSAAVQQMMHVNTTLVVLDLRHNADILPESLTKIRAALRENEREIGGQYSWLGNLSGYSSDGRSMKSLSVKNGSVDKHTNRMASSTRNPATKFTKSTVHKKDKDYAEMLEEQLQEEISHRQQLEELNVQLVDQMKQLKQQQMRLWANTAASSGSEQSFQNSSRSCDLSCSSGSSSSVPIDQTTLSYIQQAFKDIYAFIKNNQCHGQCRHETKEKPKPSLSEEEVETIEVEEYKEQSELRVNIVPKKAQSTHVKIVENVKVNKITKSAHLLGDMQLKSPVETIPDMIEKHMGDSVNAHGDGQSMRNHIEEIISLGSHKSKKSSPSSSIVNVSSETLCARRDSRESVVRDTPRESALIRDTPRESALVRDTPRAINPRHALYSSDDDTD